MTLRVASPRTTLAPGAILALGLVLMVGYVVGLLLMMTFSTYDWWGAMVIVPVLIAITIPLLTREARRQDDRRLFWVLFAGLLVKLLGAIPRYYVNFVVYHGVADASGYYGKGAALAHQFQHFDFHVPYQLSGTDFIYVLTGAVFLVTGVSKLGGFFFFSWLGFIGLFLCYRAFVIAVPEGNHKQYALLLFFLPTLVFWPSEIGKEAWMIFALGVASFGAARIMTASPVRGLLLCGLGLWLGSLVRVHIAALLALALLAGYLLRKPSAQLRQLAPVAKVAGLAVLVVGAVFIAHRAQSFLAEAGISTTGGITTAFGDVVSRTGSDTGFTPTLLTSPARAPLAAVTVLFRPFVTEAHNLQSFVAAAEGSLLLVLSVLRIRWIWTAIRSMRRQPYVAVALIYTALFVFAFSGFADFGLLVRERSQLYPLYLVLLCVPPRPFDRDDASLAEALQESP